MRCGRCSKILTRVHAVRSLMSAASMTSENGKDFTLKEATNKKVVFTSNEQVYSDGLLTTDQFER